MMFSIEHAHRFEALSWLPEDSIAVCLLVIQSRPRMILVYVLNPQKPNRFCNVILSMNAVSTNRCFPPHKRFESGLDCWQLRPSILFHHPCLRSFLLAWCAIKGDGKLDCNSFNFHFQTAPPTKSNQDIKTNQNYTHLNTMSWNLCSCVNAQFLITWQKNYLADSGLEFWPYTGCANALSSLHQLQQSLGCCSWLLRVVNTMSPVCFLICTLIWKPAMNLDRQANHCERLRDYASPNACKFCWTPLGVGDTAAAAEQGTLQKKI